MHAREERAPRRAQDARRGGRRKKRGARARHLWCFSARAGPRMRAHERPDTGVDTRAEPRCAPAPMTGPALRASADGPRAPRSADDTRAIRGRDRMKSIGGGGDTETMSDWEEAKCREELVTCYQRDSDQESTPDAAAQRTRRRLQALVLQLRAGRSARHAVGRRPRSAPSPGRADAVLRGSIPRPGSCPGSAEDGR